MPEAKHQDGYFVGEISIQKELTVAKPDGSAMSIQEALVEILNNQDKIIKLLKQNL